MDSSSARPVADDDLGLAERLVQNRLSGEVATPVGSCVGNCRRLVAGHAEYTFGLSDWRVASFENAIAALEAAGGGRLRGHADETPAFIEPAATLAGVRKHRDVLAELVAGGGGKVLVATGHPVLLPHYGTLAGALARAGCLLLRPLGDGREVARTPEGIPCSIAYIDDVAALFHGGSTRHTHLPEYMEAMLDSVGNGLPELVVADHGFAGAAIEAGIAALSIADVNDPALPLAQARGRTDGVLLIDDGLRNDLFAPVTDAILAWDSR
ncbi:MAG: phosphatase [Actinomycetota bacterium]|nr:phosphatase [Actinomycetota bacterium]